MALSRRPSPATPEPTTTEVAVPEAAESKALAVFGSSALSVEGALALTEEAAAGGTPFLFPTAELTGGASGGSFKVLTTGDESDRMPDSRKGIPGVILAYRLSIVAWPTGYNEADEGEKSKPAWKVAVPANDATLFRLATRACKNYQFTKSELRSKFDIDQNDVGHPQPTLEVLIYQPEVDGLAVVRSAKGFSAVQMSVDSLTKLADKATTALAPIPVLVKPKTVEESSKARSWKTHSLELVPMLTEEGKACFDKFKDWYAKNSENETVAQAFKTWTTCEDSPATEAIRKRLTEGAGL